MCPNDGHPLADRAEDLLLGQTVGAYRVARLLGLGGMGRVYKGVHPQIGSRVAIKVLSRECADRKDLVDRFFAEARAVNLIRHESIVNVLDLAMLPDGRPYIVMEYLDGAPLADIIAKLGPMPLGGMARLAAEVLEALGAAHAKSIVHRDLKPDNIYVTPAGRPKVLDFGIAKLLPELGGSYTQTGSLLGTPHYMAPEQALGKPVDHRTDIYSLGVILYECTTGQRPFHADSLFDLLRKHVDEAPVPPRQLRPDLPPAMEGVILAAMAKDPNQRFPSAAVMTQALMQTTQTLPPQAWAAISPSSAAMAAQGTPSGLRFSMPQSPMPPTPQPPYHGYPGQGQVATAPTAHVPGMSLPQNTPQHPQPPTAQGYAQHGHGQYTPPYPSPPPPPPPHQGTPTTATAGQVVSARKPAGSRRGLAFALIGLVLVGGGITAGVLATRDEPDGPPVAADPAPGGGSAIVVAGGDGDEPADPVAVEADDADDDDTADTADTGDDGDDADQAPTSPIKPKTPPSNPGFTLDPSMIEALEHADPATRAQLLAQIREARKQIEKNLKHLPAGSRDQLQQVLDEYKKLEKVLSAKGSTVVASDPDPDVADPPSPDPDPSTSGSKPAPPALGGPVESKPLPRPSGWNPKKFDVTGYIKTALAAAKQHVDPDAFLFRIDADGVSPDGTADLTLDSNFSVDYRFISPSRSKRPPGVKVGVKVRYECMFRILVDNGGIELRGMSGWECDEPKLGAPKCSAKQVWKTAIEQGAPADAVGSLGYRGGSSDRPTWYFGIDGTGFSEMWPDDC
jgi:serine/threonine protein kinase